MTLTEILGKLTPQEQKILASALSDVILHGHGEVNVKVTDGKILFAQGLRNYK